jgi:hypothetical protein
MKKITEYIRDHLYEICGINDTQNLDECVREQCIWSANFMRLMIHRITFGRYRYGRKDAAVCINYNYIHSIKERIIKYQKDGNLEHLVDVANLCMLEFESGKHPKRHFKAIDDGDHVE